LRNHRCKFCHRHGAQQRVDPADRPGDDDEGAVAERRRHRTGQAQNADADRGPKDEREAKAKSEAAFQRPSRLHGRSLLAKYC
jgi:hypothetical protein